MVAVHGLFALNRNETIYYTANTDSDGHRLAVIAAMRSAAAIPTRDGGA